MTDQQKRKTLKLMATAGAAGASPLALGAMLPGRKPAQGVHLSIDIVAGSAVPGDSVILRNSSTQLLRIEKFSPGIIACRDSIFDLNELCKNKSLELAPGQVVSATVEQWQVLSAPLMRAYLQADPSVTALSPHTDLISLAAMVNGTEAVVSQGNVAFS